MTAPFYRKTSDLPETISLFPLTGAILFPHANLPLNIFEPRYLNMIDDAMRGDRLIGMIQPLQSEADAAQPALSKTGCVGRIVSYSETDDGRYLIALKGVCRFELIGELDQTTPYRRANVDYDPYKHDLDPPSDQADESDLRENLLIALRDYLGRNDLKTDWSAVENAPLETLIHALASGSPFSPVEKQLLLEAGDLKDRCAALIALLQVNASQSGGTMQ